MQLMSCSVCAGRELTEQAACSFLRALGFGEVVHEPNGNKFPDFLLSGRTAIEATRLVKKIERGGNTINVTETHYGVLQSLRNVIESAPDREGCNPLLVNLDIRLPLDLKIARKNLWGFLARGDLTSAFFPGKMLIVPGLEISLIPSCVKQESTFEVGGVTPFDLGGWVLEDLTSGIEDALTRKTAKAKKFPIKYDDYWLAVGSDLTVGLTDRNYESLKELIQKVDEIWSRVILVDLNDPQKSRFLDL